MNPVTNTGGMWSSLKDKVTTRPKFLGKELQLKPAMSAHALALNNYQSGQWLLHYLKFDCINLCSTLSDC